MFIPSFGMRHQLLFRHFLFLLCLASIFLDQTFEHGLDLTDVILVLLHRVAFREELSVRWRLVHLLGHAPLGVFAA